MRRGFAIKFFVAMILFSSFPIAAWADPGETPEASCKFLDCEVSARKGPSTGSDGGGSSSDGRSRPAQRNTDTPARDIFNKQWINFTKDLEKYRDCMRGPMSSTGGVVDCGGAPLTPTITQDGTAAPNAGPPPVTPAQAGAIAAARLKIPSVAPGIGPSPNLNRWKMAAVGYPLWLWADGPTQVGPVSDSVAGLSVSLSAEVTSLTFRMGDGTIVNCAGVGDKWTKAVEPGTKAPSCGHTYTEPSLPKGNYEVAALTEWAVTWTANGQSGVINVPAVQTAELPVGELQVLVR